MESNAFDKLINMITDVDIYGYVTYKIGRRKTKHIYENNEFTYELDDSNYFFTLDMYLKQWYEEDGDGFDEPISNELVHEEYNIEIVSLDINNLETNLTKMQEQIVIELLKQNIKFQ